VDHLKPRYGFQYMFGIYSLNKPSGVSSRDVVDRVQRLVRPSKAGHAGTLDPLATGVLVVCVGPATRLVEYVQQMEKRYRGTFLLGQTSDTEDIEGTIVRLENPPVPSRSAIEAALTEFVGKIEQRPPAFSALKVEGRRAYKLARQGQPVQLKPRQVEIHGLRLVSYDYPALVLDVCCGSGTYIRSLGRDIAGRLGTGAVMSALRRTAVGSFHVDDAMDLEQLTSDTLRIHLRPPILAVQQLDRVKLEDTEIKQLSHGKQLANRFAVPGPDVAAIDASGELVAVLRVTPDRSLRPVRNFVGK
jgi:tRNA pseudouridine55 synthase